MVTKTEIVELVGIEHESFVDFAYGFNAAGNAYNLAESLFGHDVELTWDEVKTQLRDQKLL